MSSSAPISSYLQSIDSVDLQRLLGMFPMASIAARNLGETEWKDSLFATNVRDGTTYVSVPKNSLQFSGNLLYLSILKIFEIKKWIPTLSGAELPTEVLQTNDAAFFAGFVRQALEVDSGARIDANTRYEKGMRAHQEYSVEKTLGKLSHLHHGGMDKVTRKLSEMKGFTKNWWGLRGAVVQLFKSLPHSKVTHLHTYLKSKSELMKLVKTKFAFENGGIFRAEEITYLNSRYSTHKTKLDEFVNSLNTPTEELARHFGNLYSKIRTMIQVCDSEVSVCATNRARVLFPQSRKKSDIQFSKKTLTEKIQLLSEEKKVVLRPETLPGITWINSGTTERVGTELWLTAFYGDNLNDAAREVILSWYSTFESSEED